MISKKIWFFGFISILLALASTHKQLRAIANSTSQVAQMQPTIEDRYDSIDESNIDRKVTVSGLAHNAKLGAAIVTADGVPIYIDRLAEWDGSILGKSVVAIGVLRRRSLAPEPAIGSNGEISAGISGNSYILENSTIAYDPPTVSQISPKVPTAAGLADLEDLLTQQQWQAASDLTWKIFNPQGENTVDLEPISCTAIDNVDRLWTAYSDGRYGFSVQREIWQEIAEERSPTTEEADDAEAAEAAADENDEIWPLFYDRIGWNLPPEQAIATEKQGYFPVSDWWLTGETLTFGCGDYYCTIPRTVVEETVPAWNIVRSRWQDCQNAHPTK